MIEWTKLTPDAQLAAYSAIGAALLGGFISTAASLAVVWLSNRSEANRKSLEAKDRQKSLARSGLIKLMHTFDYLENTARFIEKELQKQTEIPEIRDASSLVRPLIGRGYETESITIEEIAFVSDPSGELVSKIFEIQFRTRNIEEVVKAYNQLRLEFDDYLERHISGVDGMTITVEIEGADAIVATAKRGRLNNLISELVEMLEKDRVSAREIAESYVAQMRARFPEDFKNLTFEVRN